MGDSSVWVRQRDLHDEPGYGYRKGLTDSFLRTFVRKNAGPQGSSALLCQKLHRKGVMYICFAKMYPYGVAFLTLLWLTLAVTVPQADLTRVTGNVPASDP